MPMHSLSLSLFFKSSERRRREKKTNEARPTVVGVVVVVNDVNDDDTSEGTTTTTTTRLVASCRGEISIFNFPFSFLWCWAFFIKSHLSPNNTKGRGKEKKKEAREMVQCLGFCIFLFRVYKGVFNFFFFLARKKKKKKKKKKRICSV